MANGELEIELTFLARGVPDLARAKRGVELVDYYFPEDPNVHPRLRVRKKGDSYTITKKMPADSSDASIHHESTIDIAADEFTDLTKGAKRSLSKSRYEVIIDGHDAEVDVFSGPLTGLVLVDFEFSSFAQRDAFVMPDICLADVTQEDFIAGGLLAGKSFKDIEDKLKEFGDE